MNTLVLFAVAFLLAGIVTAGSLPLLHRTIGSLFIDAPYGIKQHKTTVPVLGGCAIMLGLAASLIFIRYTTNFPTGTLHSLRGILCGAAIIFALGVLDDMTKPRGVSIVLKLAIQSLAALCLLGYGVHIELFDSPQLSYPLTFLWVVGLTNAFNLLDISDGLCVGQAVVCSLGLLLITLPGEHLYVNFCACALLGSCIGFWPYNHAQHFKTFLGDSGSTLLGFLLSALAMGADYTQYSNVAFLAPLLIFAVPLFDTGFVSVVRLLQGKNPLRGSPDHAALRLAKLGLSSRSVLYIFLWIGLLFNLLAFTVTQVHCATALTIYGVTLAGWLAAAIFLARIRMDK